MLLRRQRRYHLLVLATALPAVVSSPLLGSDSREARRDAGREVNVPSEQGPTGIYCSFLA
jgi:hypothetical protein